MFIVDDLCWVIGCLVEVWVVEFEEVEVFVDGDVLICVGGGCVSL